MAQETQVIAFVNVNVVPMDSERILEHQTVVIQGERITVIGTADEVVVPQGAEIVDGNGAYLMPGLADMHTHLTFDADPNFLCLFLAQGVTTVRNLNAIPEHLLWREGVANGDLLGPNIYTSGNVIVGLPEEFRRYPRIFRVVTVLAPLIVGILIWITIWLATRYTNLITDFGPVQPYLLPSLAGLLLLGGLLAWFIPLTTFVHPFIHPAASVPESETEARKFVREQKAAGVDFIKVYDYLPLNLYLAVLDEAEKLDLYTVGHILDNPDVVSLEQLVEYGFNEVAHVDEFSHEFWPDFVQAQNKWVEYEIDMSRIDEVAAFVAENNIAVTLTLITDETVLLGLEDLEGLLQRPAYEVVRPKIIHAWRSKGRFVNWKGQERYRREQWRPLLLALTKALHDHGAILNTGTDLDVEGIVPGYSVHLELPLLVEAGLTPFEAL